MVKKLEKRFVLTTMLSILILLSGLIGMINITNAVVTSKNTDELLEIISVTIRDMTEEEKKKNREMLMQRRSAVFFRIYTDYDNKITNCNTKRMPDLSNEEGIEIAQKVIDSGKASGRTGNFKYKSINDTEKKRHVYIFLDISVQKKSGLSFFLLSFIIGTLCFIVMYFPVCFISRKAIRQIAENIEKQKQFVTDAGHELKTPLAIIMSNTEAMELLVGENKYSRNIRKQIIRLNNLMQNLLALSKADELSDNYKKEELCISDVAVKTVNMFSEAMDLKRLDYKDEIVRDLRVISNKELVSNIISILTDNAVQYAKEEGFVSVRLFKEDKNTVFKILNNCEVLPKCDCEKLFDRFYREDKARTQKKGGSGIGLSAAKSMVNALGGKITAEYLPNNVICFTVIIP